MITYLFAKLFDQIFLCWVGVPIAYDSEPDSRPERLPRVIFGFYLTRRVAARFS